LCAAIDIPVRGKYATSSGLPRQPADRPVDDLRIVSCHLGGGCSIAAIDGGRSVDTTMGYTPLDGLPMATRSGSVDPGLVIHLLRCGVTIDELDDTLQHHSGLLGLSGCSADLTEVIAYADVGDDSDTRAVAVYLHRLQTGFGAMLAALDGLDAVVVSGGAAVHTPAVHHTLHNLLRTFGLDAPLLVEAAREDWCVALAAAAVASDHPLNG